MNFIKIVINVFLDVYMFLILARVLLSWFPRGGYNGLTVFIRDVTEPLLGFVRKLVPPLGGVLDISPILILFVFDLIKSFLNSVL